MTILNPRILHSLSYPGALSAKLNVEKGLDTSSKYNDLKSQFFKADLLNTSELFVLPPAAEIHREVSCLQAPTTTLALPLPGLSLETQNLSNFTPSIHCLYYRDSHGLLLRIVEAPYQHNGKPILNSIAKFYYPRFNLSFEYAVDSEGRPTFFPSFVPPVLNYPSGAVYAPTVLVLESDGRPARDQKLTFNSPWREVIGCFHDTSLQLPTSFYSPGCLEYQVKGCIHYYDEDYNLEKIYYGPVADDGNPPGNTRGLLCYTTQAAHEEIIRVTYMGIIHKNGSLMKCEKFFTSEYNSEFIKLNEGDLYYSESECISHKVTSLYKVFKHIPEFKRVDKVSFFQRDEYGALSEEELTLKGNFKTWDNFEGPMNFYFTMHKKNFALILPFVKNGTALANSGVITFVKYAPYKKEFELPYQLKVSKKCLEKNDLFIVFEDLLDKSVIKWPVSIFLPGVNNLCFLTQSEAFKKGLKKIIKLTVKKEEDEDKAEVKKLIERATQAAQVQEIGYRFAQRYTLNKSNIKLKKMLK